VGVFVGVAVGLGGRCADILAPIELKPTGSGDVKSPPLLIVINEKLAKK
jgi:hypothetical protein